MNAILLISAVFTCLAAGVLTAYGICNAVFSLMRFHSEGNRARAAAASQLAEVSVTRP